MEELHLKVLARKQKQKERQKAYYLKNRDIIISKRKAEKEKQKEKSYNANYFEKYITKQKYHIEYVQEKRLENSFINIFRGNIKGRDIKEWACFNSNDYDYIRKNQIKT